MSLQDSDGKPIGGRMLCWLTPEGKYLAMLTKKQVEAKREALKKAQEEAKQAAQTVQPPPPPQGEVNDNSVQV